MHKNNFDLIRLAAALQVALAHGERFIVQASDTLRSVLEFIPGVPVFFFISGFLISASCERSSSLGSFAIKRVLRIFPALWFCVIGVTLVLAVTGYLAAVGAEPGKLLIWLAAQLSFLQFYNPDFMRQYGAGIVNPALWTISVELQFYVMMPLLLLLFRVSRGLFFGLFLFFVAISATYSLYLDPIYGETTAAKLLGVSFIPWIAMFIVGVIAQFYWPRISRFFVGKLAHWALIYLVCALIGSYVQNMTGIMITGNRITILLFLPLSGLILALAYADPRLSGFLRGNDISYGLYLWHMPVIGTWLYLGLPQTYAGIVACVVIAIGVALLSWFAVERPALAMKPKTQPRVE